MVNSRAKGNRSELKAVKKLEAEGYLVYRVKGSTKFNLEVDIFGLFDILAIMRIDQHQIITTEGCEHRLNNKIQKRRWIQIKTNKRLYGKEVTPFNDFKENYCDDNDSVEIWNFKDRVKDPEIKTL